MRRPRARRRTGAAAWALLLFGLGLAAGPAPAAAQDPVANITTPTVEVREGRNGFNTNIVFTVTMTGTVVGTAIISYTVNEITATQGRGKDYIGTGSSLVFVSNESSKEISILVEGDNDVEPDETFEVVLVGAFFAELGTSTRAVGTILNDDFPDLSIDSPSVTEGGAGSTTALTFTASLSERAYEDVTVDYAVTGGTAASGTDYGVPMPAGTIVIPNGALSATLTVPVVGDDVVEGDETVEVTLSNARGASIRQRTGTGTILNDDLPVISVDSPSVIEGAGGGLSRLVFTVSLSAPGPAVTFDWEITPGRAMLGSDYSGVTRGTITIPAGSTSRTFSIDVVRDDNPEDDETIIGTIRNVVNAMPTTTSGIGTIVSDDLPGLSIDSPAADEGGPGATTPLVFTVELVSATAGDVTVEYAVTGGTAMSGADYGAATPASPLTIAAGDLSATFTVPVVGDGVTEPDETVEITLSNPVGTTLGRPMGTGTIRNDDFDVSIDSPSVTEGNSGETADLAFEVSLSAPAPAGGLTVEYAVVTASGTADAADYGTPAPASPLTIPAGASSTTITVPVTGDDGFEYDDTVVIRLSNPTGGPPGATINLVNPVGTGTILNDDVRLPEISIDSPSADEAGPGATTTLTFTVSMTATAPVDVTVEYAVTGGDAMAGVDYGTATPASPLVIPAGALSTTFTVPVTGDDEPEQDETVEITLANPSGAMFQLDGGGKTGVGTIRSDDIPGISIDSPVADESGAGETGSLVFTVSLPMALSGDATVEYAVTGGSATDGVDYGTPFPASPLTIPAGATATTLTVPITGDDVSEPDETVEITLSMPSGFMLGRDVGTGRIRNDDNTLSLGLHAQGASSTVTDAGEGGAGFSLRVDISPPASHEVTVGYRLAAGSVAAAADFQNPVGTLVIPAGQGSTSTTVVPLQDAAVEPHETVVFELVDPRGAAADPAGSRATGTLVDDDGLITLVPANRVELAELGPGSTTPVVVEARLDEPLLEPVTLIWRPERRGTSATPDDDFLWAPNFGPDAEGRLMGRHTIPAGTTSATFTLATIIGDGNRETDQAQQLVFETDRGVEVAGGGAYSLVIRNDDHEFFVNSGSVTEGPAGATSSISFRVRLFGTSPATSTLDYRLVPVGATAGVDYRDDSGTLTFGPRVRDLTLSVTILGDDEAEGDETFLVVFENPVGYPGSTFGFRGAATATATIVDDDPPRFSIDSPAVDEGAAGATTTLGFTVTLNPVWPTDVSVGYELAAASGTATADFDYAPLAAGRLEFPAGLASTSIEVVVLGDDIREEDETVAVRLTDPRGGSDIGTGLGTGTIRNDDATPLELSIDSPAVDEGAAGETPDLVFTVSLSAPAPGPVTVAYGVGGMARPGIDFGTPVPASPLTIPAGASSTTLTVPVTGDAAIEGDETVVITLSNPTGSAVFPGGAASLEGTGTIRNDDFPEVSIDSPSVTEGALGETAQLVFTVSLSATSAGAVTVEYAVTGGTAASGTDYGTPTPASPVTIAAGASSTTVAVPVTGDDTVELDETVEITISNPNGATLRAGGETGTGTIVEDDLPVVSIDSPSELEGDSGDPDGRLRFTIRLDRSPATGTSVTVRYRLATAEGTATVDGDGTKDPGEDYETLYSGQDAVFTGGGPLEHSFNVIIYGDDAFELDETVVIGIESAPGAVIGTATGTGTILNDDLPEVSIDSPSVTEGASGQTPSLTFTVTLSSSTAQNVTVAYTVTGGTAAAGVDYGTPVPPSPLTIAAGATTTTLTVPVTGDGDVEDDETVVITLSAPNGAVIGTATGTGTILNDDLPEVSIDSPSVAEGATGQTPGLVFTVSLSATSFGDVTVDYAVTGGDAQAGVDYGTPTPASPLTIPAGSTSTTITVPVTGDAEGERDETVVITLSGPSGATLRAGGEKGTGTILNDDLPEVSIDSPSVAEGATGQTPSLTFTVSLSATSTGDVTVAYAVTGGTAMAGVDYGTPMPASPLTILAGATSTTLAVPVTGDGDVEDDETVVVTLSNPGGATLRPGGETGTGMIVNDDLPEVSIDSPSVTEGAAGQTPGLVFTVSLSATSTRDVTVAYTVTGGDAQAGVDYGTPTPASPLTIPAGATSTTVTVPVTGDAEGERDETVVITLSGPSGATLRSGGEKGTGTILNDDLPEVSIDSPSVAEGASGDTPSLTFTVSLSATSTGDVTVAYAVTGGSAMAGADYGTPTPASPLMIGAGATSTTVTVPVTGDGDVEDDETVVITLSGPNGATLRSGGETGTGTIRNDDLPRISIDSPSVTEGNFGQLPLRFTVSLSATSTREVTVEYMVAGGSAMLGIDYGTPTPASPLRIPAGSTSTTITVQVAGDAAGEPNETVVITLSNPNGALLQAGGETGTGTIRNDDLPTLSIDSPSVDEGASGETPNLTFTVSLSSTTTGEVTVNYAVTGGDAQAGVDYGTPTPASPLTIPAGSTSTTITVPVTGDNAREPNEMVVITLSGPNGAVLPPGRQTGTGTIRNDDLPRISINSPSVDEGNSGQRPLTFTVSLSAVSPQDVTVEYAVTGGTATLGTDYGTPTPASPLRIPAGSLSTMITVQVAGDVTGEPNETVVITLSNPNGALLQTGGETGTGTIRNDDLPALSIDSPEVLEGASGETPGLVFTVSLSATSTGNVTVAYAVTGGDAQAGVDYGTPTPASPLTIPAGSTSTTITVPVTGDAEDESDETVVITLSNPSGAVLLPGSQTGTGTIRDDELPRVSIDSPSVIEGNSGQRPLTFTVSLSSVSTRDVTVAYAVTGGSATAGTDYGTPTPASPLTIRAGSLSTTLAVPVTGDTVSEPHETVVVTLSNPNGALLRPGGETGTGTIRNDELPELSIDSPTASEGGTGDSNTLVFTVSLSSTTTGDVTVWYSVSGGTSVFRTDHGVPVPTGQLRIPAGATSTKITVPIIGDDAVEPDKTLVIALQLPSGATIRSGGGTGTGTVLDDDFPELSINSPSVDEGAAGETPNLTFTVSLSSVSAQEVTVEYAVTGVTAQAGTDYGTATPASPLRIPAGMSSATLAVPVTGDDVFEGDETVTVTLSNPNGATIRSGGGTGTGTIRNDDSRPPVLLPEISINSPAVDEGGSGDTRTLVFTVMLSMTAPGDVTVQYAVTGGTAAAGVDYGTPAPASPLTIPAGLLSTTFTVPVTGDDVAEPDETVVITLSNPSGATLLSGGERGTGTIRNDDQPRLSIDSPSVAEGAAGERPNLAFTVSLSATTTRNVTVAYAVTGGSAGFGTDYGPPVPASPLTIAAGALSTTLAVPVIGDAIVEPDETVTVTLSNPNGALIQPGRGTGTGTIRNDDSPELSIDSPSVDEGGPGETPSLVFTVSLSGTSPRDVTVRYSVAGGTAGFGTDYGTPTPANPLTIRAGTLSTTLTVPVIGDALTEPDETVLIALSSPNGATIRTGAGTGTGTIRNDELPTLTVDAPAVDESSGGSTTTLVFTVELSEPATEDVTVVYRVSGGTAQAGSDFQDVSGTLVIRRGQRTGTITIPVLNDDVGELRETVVVELSAPTGAKFEGGGSTLEAEGAIRNDDPALSIDSTSVDEGAAGERPMLVFPVMLAPSAALPVTVNWSVTGGSATGGIDYQDGSGTLTFAPGETMKTVSLTVIGDDVSEGDETVEVTLSGPTNAAVVGGPGEGTILEDDRTASIDSPSVDEGDVGTATLTFRVALSGPPPSQDVLLDWRVVTASTTATSAPATAGTDYRPLAGGTLRFAAPTETVKTIAVTVLGDRDAELDETVTIEISNPRGGVVIRTARGTGTIRNDDRPTVSISSSEVREGASGATTTMTFEVTLSGPASEDVTVTYTLGGTAESGADFTDPGGGTIVIPAGATRGTITIAVLGDGQGEPTETVTVQLTGPGGVAVTGTGTIRNDDPVLTVDSPSVAEGALGETRRLPFTVTVDPPASGTVTVAYEVLADGTAATGTDYRALAPGTLTIPAGAATATVAVVVIGDDEPEDDETVVLRLSNPSGADILAGGARATGTIQDDDGNLEAQAKALAYVLSGVGRTLAVNLMDAIWSRVDDHRTGVGGMYGTIGGRAIDPLPFTADGGAERGSALRAAVGLAGDLLGVETDSPGALLRDAERRLATGRGLDAFRDWARLPDREDLVGRTRFAVPLDENPRRRGGAGSVTLWGRGHFTSYESEIEDEREEFSDFAVEGEVVTGHLGLDYRSNGFLVGIALGTTSGEADYRFADETDGRGVVKTELTSAHPYLHWMSPNGFGIWFAAGYGEGSAEVEEERGREDEKVETDITMEMAAAGLQGDLSDDGVFTVKFDAFGVRITADETDEGEGLAEVEGEAARARLAFQAADERVLSGGGVIAGSFELGARYDGGDAEKGSGADVALGFRYSVPHLGLELRGQGGMLVAHEQDGYREWNAGLGLALGGAGDRREQGLQFLFEPVWRSRTPVGNAAPRDAAPGTFGEAGPPGGGAALNARLAYGMGVLDERMLVTVFGELGRSGGDDRFRLGASLRQRGEGGLGLELYGERRDLSGGRQDRALFLKGRLGF